MTGLPNNTMRGGAAIYNYSDPKSTGSVATEYAYGRYIYPEEKENCQISNP